MKPIVIFFTKPKDLLAFGNKAKKDPEVEACEEMNEDLWKRFAITERSQEFICVRVNTRKADKKLLRHHRVSRSPVVAIIGFDLKQIFFSSSPKLSYSTLGKWMDRAQKKVEAEVKKLAQSDEDSPLVERAKKRALEIEQRELYEKGLEALNNKKYDSAEEFFQKAVAIEANSPHKAKSEEGFIEIKAAKMLEEAEQLYKQRRFKQCKEKVEELLRECKKSKFFLTHAKELLTKVVKKLG